MNKKEHGLDFVSRYYKENRLNVDKAYRKAIYKSGLTEAAAEQETARHRQWRAKKYRAYGFSAMAVAAAVICFIFVLQPKGNSNMTTLIAYDNIAEYTLGGDTKVVLAPHSTLSYDEGNCREVTIAGKVYFDIRHDEARPFRIKGSGFVINDLGTKLQVSSSTDENNMPVTDVIVSEGEVSFSRDGNPARTVNVRAGQAARLNHGAEQPEIIAAASNKMTWATHKFHFKNAPLSEVLNDLSDYYEVKLHCNDMNHSLTADLNADSLDTIISIINETFDINIQTQK